MNYFQREQYCGVSTQGLYHLPALPSSQGFSAWSGEHFPIEKVHKFVKT